MVWQWIGHVLRMPTSSLTGRSFSPSVPLGSRSDAELDQTIVGIALFFAISITKAFQLTRLRTVSNGRAEKMSGFDATDSLSRTLLPTCM